MTIVLLLSLCATGAADKPDTDTVVKDAREVVAAIVEFAKATKARGKASAPAEILDEYVRRAAGAARKLPRGRQGPAFALGLAVAVDTSSLMRSNPAVRATWRRVESDAERKTRLSVLRAGQIDGRHDLAQHFVVSMGLMALLGEKKAESAGLVKELLDAAPGGSGFSFADLAADYAGVAFAKLVIEHPERLEAIEKGFRVKDFALSPKGLAEGLSLEAFEKRYGGAGDARFRKERDELKRRIAGLPGFEKG